MADTDFTKLVPGFDFLQGLVKNAGSALPGIGQWVAPTLDPDELTKRIEELRTVQFWLEQNARMLGATIQALEVQRMTLSTLKTMNVQMTDLRDSMKIKMPEMSAAASEPSAPPERKTAASKSDDEADSASSAAQAGALPGVVDPMQWWGALTKQFTTLATDALKDSGPLGDLAAGVAGMAAKSAEASTGAKQDADASDAPAKSTASRKRGGAGRPR